MPDLACQIVPARSAGDIEAARRLFAAYADALGVDLSYQGFPAELASLPGQYAPPGGELCIARDAEGEAIGCAALRPIEPDGCCELKRLYVLPGGRGLGIGVALAKAIISEAERIGYREIRLDTLPTMHEAMAIYERLGFARIEPYYSSPVAGTIFLSKALRCAASTVN